MNNGKKSGKTLKYFKRISGSFQVIQTFGAKDKDVPSAGQQFSFRTPKEDMKNKNFTIRDFGSKYFPPSFDTSLISTGDKR